MLGQKGFEGVFTLIKGLEALPFEKQEEFLKNQRNTLEGEVVVVRKGHTFILDVVKAQGGSFTPEVAKKADEDTIPDKASDGHVYTHPRGTDKISKKSEEVDLEKSEDDEKEEKEEWAKDPEGEKDEHEGEAKKAMESVAKFNAMCEEIEKSS